MSVPASSIDIFTLGRFSISVDGRPVAADWPDETLKTLFCSLLSPLKRCFSWDRICRSTWGVPLTPASRERLEDVCLHSLDGFLRNELGISPLIASDEGIRIDYQGIQVDAFEFHDTALEGLRLSSLGKRAAAMAAFSKAESLYAGSYLPGIKGRIVENTRTGLESLHRTSLHEAMPLTKNSCPTEGSEMTSLGQYLRVAWRQSQTLAFDHDESVYQENLIV